MPERQLRHDEIPMRFARMLIVAGILAFVLLLYTVREIMNPFVVCGVGVFLLFPLRREKYVRPLLWAVVIVAGLWATYDVRDILAPFALALLFAFLFDPLVTRLSKRLPRWVSTLIILLVIVGAVVAVGMFLIPPLIVQVEQLTHSVVQIVQNVTAWYTEGGLAAFLRTFNLPEDRVKSFLADQLSPRIQQILEATFGAILTFLSSGTFVLGKIVNIILMPFLGFYLLKDFPKIRASLKRLLAAFHAPVRATRALADIDELLSSYLRGQMLVACLTGLLAGIIFSLSGVPYAFVLGLMIAVLDVVPYVGLIGNLAFSSLVVLLSPDPSISKVALVIFVILGLNLFETSVTAPRIIGKSVGLHPVFIILSIFVFAHEFGLIGLLIAVPSTAVAAYLLRAWLDTRAGGPVKQE